MQVTGDRHFYSSVLCYSTIFPQSWKKQVSFYNGSNNSHSGSTGLTLKYPPRSIASRDNEVSFWKVSRRCHVVGERDAGLGILWR